MSRIALLTAPVLLLLVLSGCTAPAPQATSEPSSDPGASAACEQVTVVVDYGPLDEPSVSACAAAGVAADVLAAADIATEGTADFGDQVVCRVNGLPSADQPVQIEGQAPFTETCETFNATAYWAMWVKTSPDGEWEYAQEGVTTQQLDDGQSLGLVYTPGTESIPPQD